MNRQIFVCRKNSERHSAYECNKHIFCGHWIGIIYNTYSHIHTEGRQNGIANKFGCGYVDLGCEYENVDWQIALSRFNEDMTMNEFENWRYKRGMRCCAGADMTKKTYQIHLQLLWQYELYERSVFLSLCNHKYKHTNNRLYAIDWLNWKNTKASTMPFHDYGIHRCSSPKVQWKTIGTNGISCTSIYAYTLCCYSDTHTHTHTMGTFVCQRFSLHHSFARIFMVFILRTKLNARWYVQIGWITFVKMVWWCLQREFFYISNRLRAHILWLFFYTPYKMTFALLQYACNWNG